MGTSGNPANAAAAKKEAASKRAAKKAAATPQVSDVVSDIGAFKQKSSGNMLQLPSELWIKARRADLTTFIQKGSVPNPLMEIVSEALAKGKAFNPEEVFGGEDGVDLAAITDMVEIVDSVIIESIIEPKVHPTPPEGEDRNDDLLYVDELEADDKMFVFQWAIGGTDDLDRFREEARADLASVEKMSGVGAAAQ